MPPDGVRDISRYTIPFALEKKQSDHQPQLVKILQQTKGLEKVIDRNCDVLPIYYDLLIVMFVSIINIYVEQDSQSLFILINIINIIW